MVLVFAAVLEYAIANYLHRQSDGLLARNSQRFNQAKISSMCHDMLNRYKSYRMTQTSHTEEIQRVNLGVNCKIVQAENTQTKCKKQKTKEFIINVY